jgi:hypothetical protein
MHIKERLLCVAVVMLYLTGCSAIAHDSSTKHPYKDRSITQTFAIHTAVNLHFNQPSGGAKPIEAVGNMTLKFTPTRDPDIFNVQWENLALRFGAFDIPIQGTLLRIERLHVGPADLNREKSVGKYNQRTKEVSLTLAMTLDPRRQTDLARLGVTSPIQFSVSETGRIDLDSGFLLTQTAPIPFQLGALTGTAEGRQFSPCVKGLFPNPTETWEVVMACPNGESFVEVCCGTDQGQACSEASAFDVANEVGPAACIAVSVLNFTPCSLSRCPVQ